MGERARECSIEKRFWLFLGAVGVAGVAGATWLSRVGLRKLRKKAFSDPATQCSIVSSSLPRGVVRSRRRVMAARGGDSGCVDDDVIFVDGDISAAFSGSDVGLLSGCDVAPSPLAFFSATN